MKHTFKTTISLLLCLIMLATTVLTSCASGDSETENGDNTTQTTTPSGTKPSKDKNEENNTPEDDNGGSGNEGNNGGPENNPSEDDTSGDKEPTPPLVYSNGLAFELNGDLVSYSVSGIGSCTDTDITIPPTYKELPVTSIYDSAFYGCTGLTSIVIPDSVTSIGQCAFECTGLTSIVIPDSVTSIGADAFSDTAYYNNASNWKNGVLYIDNHLIKANQTISATYTIKDGIKTIADNAFRDCSSLTSVTIPNSVTSIGRMAFRYCQALTSITIPDSVTSIGDGTFYECTGLTSIEIPNSVTRIASSAFKNTAYYNNASNWENGFLYIGNHLIKANQTISATYTIKDGIKTIADNAFRDCSSLTSVTIPNSVTSIGCAFSSCKGLTSITIPDSVTSISNFAFAYCTGLTNITIGNGVTSIGSYAFIDCYSLTSITYDGSVSQWNEISKGRGWNSNTGTYTIYCTDGKISKSGTVTYY